MATETGCVRPGTAPSTLARLTGVTWLAVRFLIGQGLVQVLTLLVGLLLLRVLSVEQYALYTVAGALLALVSIASNFGLSQAIVSLGAAQRENKYYVGALLNAAGLLSRRFMLPAMIVTGLTAYFMMRAQPWSLASELTSIGLVFLIGFAQVGASLGRSILNIHHDSRAMFSIGLADAGIRLLFLPLVILWPTTVTALAANLTGAIAASALTAHRISGLCDRRATGEAAQISQLTGFIGPLAPVLLYTLVQGQIAIVLLGVFADQQTIAETGALSRLGQVFNILMLLISFLVQPMFARVKTRSDFVVKSAAVLALLLLLCIVTIASAYLVPDWWLLIVGDKYAGHSQEVPVALGASLATIVGSTIYAMVVSRGSTRWQSATILPCLGGQAAFVLLNGVRSTWDALMLGLIPAVAYALVQSILLALLLSRRLFGGRALEE